MRMGSKSHDEAQSRETSDSEFPVKFERPEHIDDLDKGEILEEEGILAVGLQGNASG
jgi:hypothetical protein